MPRQTAAAPPALARLCDLAPATDPDPLAALLDWAARIAREVRRAFRFPTGSQEEDDLVSTAHVAVCRLAERFDPARVPPGGDAAGLFRGFAYVEIKSSCRREARRLRNGGTYRTRRETRGVALVAVPLSALGSADGTPFDTPAPHDDPAGHGPEHHPAPAIPDQTPPTTRVYGRRLARRHPA